MDIETGETKNSKQFVKFQGHFDEPCKLISDGLYLKFRVGEDYAILTQDHIKTILPFLQTYAETGNLEID